MNRRTKDRLVVAAGGLFLLLVLALLPLTLWLHFAAPCKYVTWMPVKDVPVRCLEVRNR